MKIGFISDIHEDIIRLKEAILKFEQFGCDEIICLGDIVGFTLPFYKFIDTRNAEECVNIVKSTCKFAVAGNHDLFAIKKVPQISPTFKYLPNWYELDYPTREKLSRNKIWLYEDSELPIKLSAGSMEYLESLEEFKIAEFEGNKYFLSHFCYPDLTGTTLAFPSKFKHCQKHFSLMEENNCSIGFSGHGHPEGGTIFNNKVISHLNFGTYSINKNPNWIVCPCSANTTRINGIMVFDTSDFQLHLIPLYSAKVMS